MITENKHIYHSYTKNDRLRIWYCKKCSVYIIAASRFKMLIINATAVFEAWGDPGYTVNADGSEFEKYFTFYNADDVS